MYQVTHKIKCDEIGCKEEMICDDAIDKADAFNMAEADGWHIAGQIPFWICPECYEGSAQEKDDQYQNECDYKYDKWKDDQMMKGWDNG